MRLEQAVKHFGSNTEVANALSINKSSVGRWKDGIVPLNHAWKLRTKSKGKLAMRLGDYR